MILLNSYTVDTLASKLTAFVKDDGEFSAPLHKEAVSFLTNGGGYYRTELSSNKYFAGLKELDQILVESPVGPEWSDTDEENDTNIQVEEELIELAATNLKHTGDYFYLYTMLVVFCGGVSLTPPEEFFEVHPLYEYMEPFRTFVIARKMSKDFQGSSVLKAAKNTHLAEPVDISEYPPFLLENNPALIKKDGKYYLTDDILKAMTAAGGFAQALEKQDLEPKVTNAAPIGEDEEEDA